MSSSPATTVNVHDGALQNASAFRVSDRARKIATALVMIADLFSTGDPFALDLRQVAVALVRDTYVHDHVPLQERRKRLLRALEAVEYAMSIIEVADRSGMVSSMNATIIDRELRLMHQFLLGQFQSIDNGHVYSERDEEISALFADITEPEPAKDSVKDTVSVKDKVQETDHQGHSQEQATAVKDTEKKDIVSFTPKEEKRDIDMAVRDDSSYRTGGVAGVKNIGQVFAERAKDAPMAPNISVGGSDRREQILEALKRLPDEVSIQEIAKAIDEDVSTKTIQRELTALMARGLVEKSGERRWSKYGLSARGMAQLNRVAAGPQ